MRHLILDNAYNTRDLGRYKISEHEYTKPKVFLRSDGTEKLSSEDIRTLISYGVKTVIDIRSQKEMNEKPDVFENVSEVDFYTVPFDSDDFAYNFAKDPTKLTISLEEGYVKLLEQKSTVANIFLIISKAMKKGTVLYHCSGGKDRTGLISMLLLSLVGVSNTDILSDYSASYSFLSKNPVIQDFMNKFGRLYCECKPDLMQSAIDYIACTYGGVYNYLLSCGVEEDILREIKDVFTEREHI